VLHRYVIVRQEDGSDCGAAALATIALHYRRPIRLFELRDLVGTDRGGTSLLAMMQLHRCRVNRVQNEEEAA